MLTANLEAWLRLLQQEPQHDPFFVQIQSELEDLSQVLDRAVAEVDFRAIHEAIRAMSNRHKPTGGGIRPQTCRHCGKQLAS